MRIKLLIVFIFVTNSFSDLKININLDKINKNEDLLTKESLMKEIIKNNIKFPEIVYAQAILETGHLKSYNCRVRHNLFGFYNGKRYLEFKNWKECIKFKKLWQDKKYKGGSYYRFLNGLPYAEDSLYCKKLLNIKYEKTK